VRFFSIKIQSRKEVIIFETAIGFKEFQNKNYDF